MEDQLCDKTHLAHIYKILDDFTNKLYNMEKAEVKNRKKAQSSGKLGHILDSNFNVELLDADSTDARPSPSFLTELKSKQGTKRNLEVKESEIIKKQKTSKDKMDVLNEDNIIHYQKHLKSILSNIFKVI